MKKITYLCGISFAILVIVVSDGNAATKLDGGFIVYYGQNNIQAWSQTDWNNYMQDMADIGFEHVITQYSVYNTAAYYNTNISGYYRVSGLNDPIGKMLSAAGSKGINVYLGLVDDSNWWSSCKNTTYLANLRDKTKSVIDELWAYYQSYGALKGFYLTPEIDAYTFQNGTDRQNLVNYFLNPVCNHVKSKSSTMKTVTSPFYTTSYSSSNYNTWWSYTLYDTPNMDTVALQDGKGAFGYSNSTISTYFNAIKNACSYQGRSFWANTELFSGSNPAAITTIAGQIATEDDYTGDFTSFDYTHYLSRMRNPKSNGLYHDYKRYKNSWTYPLILKSSSKSYSVSPSPSVSYPDSGGELTNNLAPYSYASCLGWSNIGVTIVLDLGSTQSGLYHFNLFAVKNTADGVNLPASFSIATSADGSNYTYRGTGYAISSADKEVNCFELIKGPYQARYIMFTTPTTSGWTMLNEVVVRAVP